VLHPAREAEHLAGWPVRGEARLETRQRHDVLGVLLLASAIGTPGIECTTVFKIKDLERGLIVWSARHPPAAVDESLETPTP